MTNGEKIKEIFPNLNTSIVGDVIDVYNLGIYCQTFDVEWWNAEYKEPNKSEIPTGSNTKDDLALIHTWGLDEEIRCIMCTNHMKSNRGCDGSCVVNKDMYKAVMDAIEKHIQPTNKNGLVLDCVSRQVVFETIDDCNSDGLKGIFCSYDDGERFKEYIKKLPSVTPTQKWIPVSEKLPNDRDWYLGIFKEPDTGWINPLPFICDYVGHETKATTKEHWVLRGFTDRDEHIDYYFNLECVAWMPLPQSYKEVEE